MFYILVIAHDRRTTRNIAVNPVCVVGSESHTAIREVATQAVKQDIVIARSGLIGFVQNRMEQVVTVDLRVVEARVVVITERIALAAHVIHAAYRRGIIRAVRAIPVMQK